MAWFPVNNDAELSVARHLQERTKHKPNKRMEGYTSGWVIRLMGGWMDGLMGDWYVYDCRSGKLSGQLRD
jgi:hypothetical protein